MNAATRIAGACTAAVVAVLGLGLAEMAATPAPIPATASPAFAMQDQVGQLALQPYFFLQGADVYVGLQGLQTGLPSRTPVNVMGHNNLGWKFSGMGSVQADGTIHVDSDYAVLAGHQYQVWFHVPGGSDSPRTTVAA